MLPLGRNKVEGKNDPKSQRNGSIYHCRKHGPFQPVATALTQGRFGLKSTNPGCAVRNQGRSVLGDIVDFSELREAIARRQAEAAEVIRHAEEAERAGKAETAQAARQATSAEAQIKAVAAEVARRRDLHSYIRGRGVTGLGHFTRLKNLESILRHGLLPRGTLDQMGAEYVANDELRLDHVDGVCLSISFPNYKLFYRFRKKFPEDWVVIGLSTEVIERKACIFNPCNAASGAMTRIEKERRMQMDALQEMFYDRGVDHGDASAGAGATMLRDALGLPDKFTTDPQAEVVVVESIEPELFDGVIFDCDDTLRNRQILDEYSQRFGLLWKGRFRAGRPAFTYRHDYKYWQADNG